MATIPNYAEISLLPENRDAGGGRFSASKRAEKDGQAQPAWQTPELIPVKPLYTSADLAGVDHLDTMPGFPPFVRGPYATMYVQRPWTVRQYAGFSTAKDSNAFYRRNLAAGQMGFEHCFRFGNASRLRFGPSAGSQATWGWRGSQSTAFTTCGTLFDGIPLDKMSVSMTMNGAVLPVMAPVYCRRRRTRREAGATGRDHSERHSEGVYGPQHVYLSA